MPAAATTPPQPGSAVSPGEGRPSRPGLVRRDRLIAQLTGAGDTPMLLLVAPAGYGKTTILADWTAQDRRPSAWLTLDDRHNDPALLLGAIASLLDDLEQPFVLVLDDLHLVNNADCLEPLAALVQSMPAGSQIAAASRSEPHLPLGRMRADRIVSELDASDLEMNLAEAAQTLAACGLELQSDAVKRLVVHTEGWPVGIYLAGLSLTRKGHVDAAIRDFRGDDRMVADYVRGEFLDALDNDTLNFLIESSVLDRLTGDVCDAVLDRTGSAEMLHRLVRSNLLIIPLDTRDRAYRHHALLQEMLESELGRRDSSLSARLHDRASSWFREQGDTERAIRHALQAGDSTVSGELIWLNSAAYVSSGRAATVRGWVDNFTEEQVSSSPPLCLARATAYLAAGDGGEVERWTGIALEHLDEENDAAHSAMGVAARIIRASGAARDGVERMREDVEAGYSLLASDSPWRALCRLLEGASLHLSGDRGGARTALEEGVRLSATATPSVQTLCRSQLALISIDEGDMGEAERQSQLAVAAADHYGLTDHPTQALVFAVSALVRARRGRSDAATTDAKTAVRLESGLHDMSPWYEAETRITLAKALLHLDDGLAARSHLGAAGRYLRKVNDAVVLSEWLDAAWAEIDAADSVAGRWPLTPAELRLLHVLPTHHSFRDIAERSFVSQNTVKTQAQSIYRKLGVSSRAEAVACARAAGLLDASAVDSPERGDAPSDERT